MVLRYVLKNFSRRKVRTILMVLSLMISTALIVTMSATVATLRQSNVDLVVSEVGRADFVVSKRDTSLNLYIPVNEMVATIQGADPRITSVHPRINLPIEYTAAGRASGASLVGLDPSRDDIGAVTVNEGVYELGNFQIAIPESMALNDGLAVGDLLTIDYVIPRQREPGKAETTSTSQRRIQQQFTISAIVVQNGITGAYNPILVDIADLQNWLGASGQALQMLAIVDPALYQSNNADVAALQVRDVTSNVQRQLSAEYEFTLDKALTLSSLRQFFQAAQALINTYGLISLGVVGLLVHTLVMTNVQEQRRDMAVLRILGGQRRLLFRMVIVEVVVIGMIGVGLGVVLGQILTSYVVVPLMLRQLATEGVTLALQPEVSASAIVPSVLSAFVVLILSAVKPARDASRTKVMHAINPGVADNVQLEDLTQLRERRPNIKMFLAGLGMMFFFALLAGGETLIAYGGPAVEVMFVLTGLLLLVVGLSMMFFISTIPFERLILALIGLVFPRLAYFANRNVSRGQTRNTLIAMLVLFSGVLPSFLATQTRMESVNFETSTKSRLGAPLKIDAFSSFVTANNVITFDEVNQNNFLKPSFVAEQLVTVPGLDQTSSISYRHNTQVRDSVGLRSAPITVIGAASDLSLTTFDDMLTMAAGGTAALQTVVSDPTAAIISEGLAAHMSMGIGDTIDIVGEGRDNISKAQIVGIARHIPGIGNIGRTRTSAQSGSTVLVSMAQFGRIITPLDKALPVDDAPHIETVFATLQPDADPRAVLETLYDRYDDKQPFGVSSLEVQLEWNRSDQAIQQAFLLALTGISFTTAVFGVFAVIYVTIYARRIEIGMLKAMGMLRRELTLMLILEAIAMTLGSALAGIAAGASVGYLTFYGQNLANQTPVQFAVDTTVMPAIIVLVVVASVLGAIFSARRIVRKQAVDILRM